MAFDVQVCYPQQIIKLTSVTLIEGSSPSAVEVIGDDFSAVDEVLLNDLRSPAIQVLSKNKLRAELPPTVTADTLVTVMVVSYGLVFTDRSVLSFKAGITNRKVSGINRLVQLFLKLLLTTPGTDIFNRTLGGGALQNLGTTFTRGSSNNIVGNFLIAVDHTAKQVTAVQARNPRLPRDERLLSAKVSGARFDARQTALVVSVILTSQAGDSALANIIA
jgi:hypothetical protein